MGHDGVVVAEMELIGPDMARHTCNPGIKEAEAGGSQVLGASLFPISGKPGLYRITLS